MEFTVVPINVDAVLAELNLLSKTERSRALKSGLTKAGRLLLTKEKENLRKSMDSPQGVTGNLLRSIQAKVKRGNLGIVVGFDKHGHHAHLADRGHELVVGIKRKHTGIETRALLFREKTMEQSGQQAQDKMLDGVKMMINKYTN